MGALVAVGLLVYAVVRVVAGLLGGDDSVADADATGDTADVAAVTGATADTSQSDATAADTNTGASAPEDTGPPPTSLSTDPATTDSAPPNSEPVDPDAPVSPSNPATVYIVGDSDAGTFGPYLNRLLDGTNLTDTELNYKVSSGLSRPDFFDWPAELERALPEVDPDIVVVTFGGNDAQGLSVASGEFNVGDPVTNEDEWMAEYELRAGDVMDTLLQDDRTVIWVGIPNDDNPEVTERMSIQDRAAKAAAAERPDVIFIDTWSRFSGRDGGWAEFVIDPRDGEGKDVRAGDGFHLNETGAEILALDIAQAVREALRELGASL
ncbi:MAG: DUF459 domain-containing protein [Acidimicrobiia bacterium]|nr:DUF459 domain-containing protein [Acidimicrobiia bacterium]